MEIGKKYIYMAESVDIWDWITTWKDNHTDSSLSDDKLENIICEAFDQYKAYIKNKKSYITLNNSIQIYKIKMEKVADTLFVYIVFKPITNIDEDTVTDIIKDYYFNDFCEVIHVDEYEFIFNDNSLFLSNHIISNDKNINEDLNLPKI